MFSRALISITCLAALLLAGCRTDPHVNAHIESVNAEYRQLENKLYVAEDENRRLQGDLARIEEENRRLRGGEAAPASPRGLGSSRSRPAIDGSFDLAPPEIELGADTGPAIEAPGIPPVSSPPVPRSPATDGVVPRRTNRESLDRPKLEVPAIEGPAPKVEVEPTLPLLETKPSQLPPPPSQETKQLEPEPIDTKVTQIFLNPLLTGGDSLDREPGDDGLSILVEPRNKSNQFVPQAGSVSVVVLDPAKQGDAARVARWDFDPSATRQKLNRVSSSRGIHLRLPWPANPPTTSKLRVFVRYETADGRKLQADREITISPPGQYSHRWTPRPADRPRRNPEQVAKLTPPSAPPTTTEATPDPTPNPQPSVSPMQTASTPPAATATTAPESEPPIKQPTASPDAASTAAKSEKPAVLTPPAAKSSPPAQAKRPVPGWSPYR
jgi:hypothetical protein